MFVGTGAPKGKELSLPGRRDTDRIHIGIAWLESVAFEHVDTIGERVLIIGVGNTAMDCCRTSLRIGAKSVKVMARKPRGFFKASEWELEDAEEEHVEIIVNHAPKAFVVEDGKLKGMTFERLEYEMDGAEIKSQRVVEEVFIPCDDVILAIGQENAFPWIERDLGIEFDKWDVPKLDKVTFESTRKGVFFGGDAAFGPKNIIWAVEHGHQAAISIHKHCQGETLTERMPRGVNLQSRKVGMHEWSYKNDYDPAARRLMPHVSLKERFKQAEHRSRARLRRRARRRGSVALHELRHPDRVPREALHRVRCLHRHLPDRLPDDHGKRRGGGARHAAQGAAPQSGPADDGVGAARPDRTGDGQGRGPLRALRIVRGAMPDGRLGHAEVLDQDSTCRG